MDCIFSEPKQLKDIGGNIYEMVDPYDQGRAIIYSKFSCPDLFETVVDPTTGKTFVLEKSLSYGSALTSFFILCLIILLIATFLFKIVLKRN